MDIPESTNALIADEALRDGVDELVGKLDGKKMVAYNWPQSRDYAKALGMAALARSDYVVLMHDLWDATWGAAEALGLGEPDDGEPSNPHQIWENREIYRYIALEKPISDGVYIILFVEFDFQEGVSLHLYFDDADNAETDTSSAFKGVSPNWKLVEHENFEYPYLCSAVVPVEQLDTAAETLCASASEMIALLKSSKF